MPQLLCRHMSARQQKRCMISVSSTKKVAWLVDSLLRTPIIYMTRHSGPIVAAICTSHGPQAQKKRVQQMIAFAHSSLTRSDLLFTGCSITVNVLLCQTQNIKVIPSDIDLYLHQCPKVSERCQTASVLHPETLTRTLDQFHSKTHRHSG